MGNCQAADVAAVVIQHPDGRIERVCRTLTASDVMASNPGYYVALVFTAKSKSSTNKPPTRYIKLLPPSDSLLIGHFYLLVAFEDVLREFGSKKHVRLSRVLAKQKERLKESDACDENSTNSVEEEEREGTNTMDETIGLNNEILKRKQWRQCLQSIDEATN